MYNHNSRNWAYFWHSLFKMHRWISRLVKSDIKPSVVYSKGTYSGITEMDIECSWLTYLITDKNSLEIMDGHFSTCGLVVLMLTYEINKSKVSQNNSARSRTLLLHVWCFSMMISILSTFYLQEHYRSHNSLQCIATCIWDRLSNKFSVKIYFQQKLQLLEILNGVFL